MQIIQVIIFLNVKLSMIQMNQVFIMMEEMIKTALWNDIKYIKIKTPIFVKKTLIPLN